MGCGASHKNRGAALDPSLAGEGAESKVDASAATYAAPGSASTTASASTASSPQALRSLEEGALHPPQDAVLAADASLPRAEAADLDAQIAAQQQKLEEQCRELREARMDSEAHGAEFESERAALAARYHSELEQEVEERERELALRQSRADALGEERRRQAVEEREAAEEHRLEQLRFLQRAEAEAASHVEEAQEAEREIAGLRERNEQLRRDHSAAAQALLEAQESLCAQEAECQASTNELSAREEQYAESRSEYALSEEHLADSERELQAQMQELRVELRSRTEQLHARDEALRERDSELLEVNSQLADLQGLFDDVNQQLQTECARMAQLQDTVALCAKQSKELESLQTMLEESHNMLAQVRDALESERAERVRTARLLEHEQQRTQLLLDVLKHFKEKLQGLTPQMLMSRLGADPKEFLAGFGAPKFVDDGHAPDRGHALALQSSPDFAKFNGINFGSPRWADGASSTGAPDTSSHQEWATSATLGSTAASPPTEAWRISPAQAPLQPPQPPRPALRGLNGTETQQAVFLQEAFARRCLEAGPVDAAAPEPLPLHRYAPYAAPPFALGGMPGGPWAQQAACLHGGLRSQ